MFSKKGVALFISIALLFLLSAGVVIVLLTAYNYANVTENQIKRLRAMKLAEAGIAHGYYQLRTDSNYASTYVDEGTADIITPDSSGLSVKIWIEDPGTGRYTLKSKVEY